MTREEVKDCLKLIQANYENYHPSDLKITLNLWAESFKDDPAEKVQAAVWSIIQTSTSNFAPKIGQVRQMMMDREPVQAMNEAEAWTLVYNAVCNSGYYANEEFNKLPADVRRAMAMLPERMRIPEKPAPVAAIESKETRSYGESASPKYVAELLRRWRDDSEG